MKRAVAVLLSVLVGSCAIRAETVEKHVLKSAELGDEREIWVALPDGYAGGGERYQVLYVLDADGLFPAATAYASYLPLGGQMPPLLVVGVRSKRMADRTRVFTPPVADRFLAFLTREVRPFVERRYRTQPFATLAGHSMAGLFAIYALAREPRSFDAYFAFSPVLAWKQGLVMTEYGESLFGPRTAGRFLYVSSAVEPQFPQRWTEDLARRLGERSSAAPKWKYTRFDHEDHFTTVPPAMWDAMRWLYGDWAVPDYAAATPESLDEHYRRLSAKFGYPIAVPESAISLYGYTMLGSDRPKEGVRAFLFYTERYPASPDAWEGLAEAYEADGRAADAKAAREKALKLRERHP